MYSRKRADNTETIPLPQVFTPSGDFNGNDGKWSTFTINIGDAGGTGNGQNFKVLISTSSPLTLVPRQADWCNDEECAKRRGIMIFDAKQPLGFESSSSKTWNEQGLYNIPVPDWWTGAEPNGTWGLDNVGLGQSDPNSIILQNQWVVEHGFKGLFMGSFGLAVGAVSIGDGAARNPFLTNFAASLRPPPSASYGYTAGAVYQNNSKGTLGNLVFGGFDQSRLKQQGISISMPSSSNNTLVVGVQSILYHPNLSVDANDYSFTDSAFFATIDSTLPHIHLPDDICDKFAEKFLLQFDENTGLYTVNDTSHEHNLQQNANVTFKIGSGTELSTETTTITLPYAAFDLQASSPIYANATNYFPIKKSTNGIFILGRTFLQEAYIIVDYERANFTVAPTVYSNPMPPPQIVPIYRKDYVPPNGTNTPTSSKKGLAPGAIVGIVVSIVIIFLLLGLGAFFWRKRRASKEDKAEISEIDTMVPETEFKHLPVSEIDSNPQGKPAGGFYGGVLDNKDQVSFPPMSEMESPPAELYSPPTESAQLSASTPVTDRGIVGGYFFKPRRRGATRESSQSNTPGTPVVSEVHELPGDDVQFNALQFDRVESPTTGNRMHSRGPSDTSLQTNIDEVISGRPEGESSASRNALNRRPSHARGASDTTINSDTTAVSQPTPEEIENWALGVGDEPRRPLSE